MIFTAWQVELSCRRCRPVHQWMGRGGRRLKRRNENRLHSQPGQPHLARPLSHLRQRCLGACLLPQIQQPPSRIPASVVERSQLGRNQQTLPSVTKEVGRVVPGLRPVQSLAWGGPIRPPRFSFFLCPAPANTGVMNSVNHTPCRNASARAPNQVPRTVPNLCTPCANSGRRARKRVPQFSASRSSPAVRMPSAVTLDPCLIPIHHYEPANRNSTVAQFLCN